MGDMAAVEAMEEGTVVVGATVEEPEGAQQLWSSMWSLFSITKQIIINDSSLKSLLGVQHVPATPVLARRDK